MSDIGAFCGEAICVVLGLVMLACFVVIGRIFLVPCFACICHACRRVCVGDERLGRDVDIAQSPEWAGLVGDIRAAAGRPAAGAYDRVPTADPGSPPPPEPWCSPADLPPNSPPGPASGAAAGSGAQLLSTPQLDAVPPPEEAPPECCVCLAAAAAQDALAPCGHRAACRRCARRLQRCPLCRTELHR